MKRSALLGKLTLALSAIVLLATPVHSALLYYADFETYDSGESLSIGTLFDGANDTFTAKATNGTYTAQSAGNPFSTGNYAQVLSGATTSIVLRQIELAPFGTGDVRVMSFDIALSPSSTTGLSFAPYFINTGNMGLGFYGGSTMSLSASAAFRVTAVYNQTAASIVLPGSLGSVDTGEAALYFKDGLGNYTLVGSIASADVGGAGFGFSWGAVAVNDSALFDNFGFWSSASDTVGGTSVLELNIGTVPVPEPSAFLLLLGSGAVCLCARRRLRLS